MNSDQLVIEARGIEKRFGPVRALAGLDLTVRAGEVHGFLGPNGAGKSTTLRALLGLLRLDGGSARMLGGDPWRDATELHKRLAYVPGDVALWPELTGGEVLELLGRLRGAPDLARRRALSERFELDLRKRCAAYSKGNRQKVALVSALSSNAELLLLDEPTSGLDPLMESIFRECITEERARGRTVLLSSHVLAEVEALCDRVTIVRAGRVVEHGSLRDLRHLTRTTVQAELGSPAPSLAALEGVHGLSVDGLSVRFAVEPAALDAALRALTTAGVRALQCHPPTLEELFLRHYRADGAEAAS